MPQAAKVAFTMKKRRGHPTVSVRLHPSALEQLRKRASDLSRGQKGGGVAAYIRQLVYEDLGFDSGEQEAVSER